MARGDREKPTLMQQRAIDLFRINLTHGGTTTVEQILLEAGYDATSARQDKRHGQYQAAPEGYAGLDGTAPDDGYGSDGPEDLRCYLR
jgi:hypothetical protein